jgi:hypothetical protein
VVVAVRDDMANPWDVLVKNAVHEEKVKSWAKMSREEKVVAKMEDILRQVGGLGGVCVWGGGAVGG